MVLSTRAGTNNFHGEAYEFFKNDAMNASDWYSNKIGVPKAPFHDNVFGFTFGGPVTIPKVYKGKDKTFFFLNFEGDRHSSGSYANILSVPTALERQGDFSQSILYGVPVQIFDPATGALVNGGSGAPALPAGKNSIKPLQPDGADLSGLYALAQHRTAAGHERPEQLCLWLGFAVPHQLLDRAHGS